MNAAWPHQIRAVDEFKIRRANGARRIIIQSPTGMGKTWIAERLIRDELELPHGRALLYTGRRVMLEQLQRDMAGISFGVRAAGYIQEGNHAFQIASLPTDKARSKKDNYEDFPATIVLVDEAHMHTSAGDQRCLDRHLERGAVLCLLTATPIGMEDVADCIIVAGTKKEGRECGALVRARHYGPDEPAIVGHHKTLASLLDLSENETRKAMGQVTDGKPDRKAQALFGRVLEWFDKLNKKRKPTLLFAPGVPESRWFCEQFMEHGITAAHIDGEQTIINGVTYGSEVEVRESVRRGSEVGDIQVVCTRFVLREGANWPWLAHGIFATVFDSLQSYLQAGGRLLRSHPSLRTVCIQDHGGNWWRHGSLNEDRNWQLSDTSRIIAGVREDTFRDSDGNPEVEPTHREPVRCPMCAAICMGGGCIECEFRFEGLPRYREVAQANGTLVRITGKMFPAYPVRLEEDTKRKWQAIYWQMKNAKKPKTFNQAYIFFHHKHGYRPPRNLPKMPLDSYDWYRPISAVALNRLRPDPDYKPGARRGTRKPKPNKNGQKGLFDEQADQADDRSGS